MILSFQWILHILRTSQKNLQAFLFLVKKLHPVKKGNRECFLLMNAYLSV